MSSYTYLTPMHVLTHTTPIHVLMNTHAHFHYPREIPAVHTVAIHTSLVHMPGVRSHKQVTYLHHVPTYSTFTHCLPLPASTLPSTQTFPNRRPHGHAPRTHSHPPAPTLHAAPWGALHPPLPRPGAEKGGFVRRGGGQGLGACMECSGHSQASWNRQWRPVLIDHKRDWTPKGPFAFAFSPPRSPRPAPNVWARPAQVTTAEPNSVSKLYSTDNLFRPVGHPACSASPTPCGLTETPHTPAGQI